MSGSLPDEVLAFLRSHGLAAPDETPAAVALAGGVSSDIWRVELRSGPIAVKRALARLRVAQVWEAPVERNRYEHQWLTLANTFVPGCAPKVLAADNDSGVFAMEYLGGLPLWKAELRAGRADAEFAARVGKRLAQIHARGTSLGKFFETDRSFHAIRLEPYLLATARAHPALEPPLRRLAERTARTKLTLVHGDVSPKNILVGPEGPIFLDAECAWYGDPAFDLAFCLNHMLLKCVWVPDSAAAFLSCFDSLSREYLRNATWENSKALEQRIATLLPGLLLARVDGKSPVEYITAASDKERVRSVATKLLRKPPASLAEVRIAWRAS